MRNIIIELNGLIETVKDGKIVQISKGGIEMPAQSRPDASASIEDIIEQLSMAKAIQMQGIYNAIQTRKEINSLKEVLNKVLVSLSKTDENLIGTIIGKLGKSKWLNEEVFYLYPCNSLFESVTSNCFGDHIYKHGRPVNKTPDDLCFSFPEEDVHEIEVYTDSPLSMELFTMQAPEEASSDWEGWSWMVESSLKTSNMVSKMGDSESGLFNQVMTSLPWSLSNIWQTFLGFSSIVAYISLFLALCRR